MSEERTDPALAEALFYWQHPDYVVYHKDFRWYAISLVLLVFAVAWTVIDANYMFGAFLILFYLVLLMFENRPPEMVEFAITPEGIKSGKSFHYYRDIDCFYIIYRAEGIKNLYFEFRNPLKGRLVIPLDGQNAVAVRDHLLGVLREDLEREAEPLTDQLRRWLKI